MREVITVAVSEADRRDGRRSSVTGTVHKNMFGSADRAADGGRVGHQLDYAPDGQQQTDVWHWAGAVHDGGGRRTVAGQDAPVMHPATVGTDPRANGCLDARRRAKPTIGRPR
jgi:hypothetical protein